MYVCMYKVVYMHLNTCPLLAWKHWAKDKKVNFTVHESSCSVFSETSSVKQKKKNACKPCKV